MSGINLNAAEIDRAAVRRVANRVPKRIREQMKPGPITIIKGDGTAIVEAQPAAVPAAMPTPGVLTKPIFTPREHSDERPIAAAAPAANDSGLLPTEGYADVVNQFAAEGV